MKFFHKIFQTAVIASLALICYSGEIRSGIANQFKPSGFFYETFTHQVDGTTHFQNEKGLAPDCKAGTCDCERKVATKADWWVAGPAIGYAAASWICACLAMSGGYMSYTSCDKRDSWFRDSRNAYGFIKCLYVGSSPQYSNDKKKNGLGLTPLSITLTPILTGPFAVVFLMENIGEMATEGGKMVASTASFLWRLWTIDLTGKRNA